jgi:prepilin-type N-terminal cleavage/methylation domain-containing protein
MIAHQQSGFTLLEVLLCVALLGMLVGISLPVYASFNDRNSLSIAAEQTASALRRAQVYARGAQGDTSWGVEVQSSAVTLFKGASFAGRDATYDEVTTIPGPIAATGLGEVLFAKLSGAPSTTGSITLTIDTNNIRTVTLNAKGMVTY